MIRNRLGDGVRAVAAVFTGPAPERHGSLEPIDEGRPPDWLAELDDHEDAEELSFALYCDLGEVVEARTGVAAGRRDHE